MDGWEQKLWEKMRTIEREETSMKRYFVRYIVFVVLLLAALAAADACMERANALVEAENIPGTCLFSIQTEFQPGSLFYVAGVGLYLTAVITAQYCIFDYRTPFGWHRFFRKYQGILPGILAAMLSLYLPVFSGLPESIIRPDGCR